MTLSLAEVDILSLIRADAGDLRRKSNTPHAEWCGACPWCGGRDRFIVWPEPRKGNPRYWCRQCGKRGDAIAWLRERHGLTFAEACRALSIETERQTPSAARRLRAPATGIPTPPQEWQDLARAFAEDCAAALWTRPARPALAWLRARGLSDDTIERAGLGFNPAERDGLPVGVVIPWRVRGHLVAVKVRQSDAALARDPKAPKYKHRGGAGSPNDWLYNADALDAERVVMVESELSALAIQQAAGDLVVAVATGGTGNARHVHWRARLALAEVALQAFDADDAGDKGAAFWCDLPNVARWRPERKDPGDMLRDDGALAVRRWIADGLGACIVCGAPVSFADGRYTPDGWPVCDAHQSAVGGEPSQIEPHSACGDELQNAAQVVAHA